MSSDSKKICPVLPSGLSRPVCSSAVAAVGVGLGTYVALRRSDLKIAENWDLQDNKYIVPGISIAVAATAASTVGLISYLLANRN